MPSPCKLRRLTGSRDRKVVVAQHELMARVWGPKVQGRCFGVYGREMSHHVNASLGHAFRAQVLVRGEMVELGEQLCALPLQSTVGLHEESFKYSKHALSHGRNQPQNIPFAPKLAASLM